MANEQNLKPSGHKFTLEEAKRGAKNSAKSRRDKRRLKDCLEILAEKRIEIEGERMSGMEAIALSAFQKAIGGDVKAMEFIRDSIGQKPVDKVITADVDPSVIEEVERMVFSDADEE